MIRYIGKLRLIIIILFALVNMALVGLLFGYISPSIERYDRKVNDTRGKSLRLVAQASNIEEEYKKFIEYQKQYEKLKATGFFIDQDRFIAKKVLDHFQGLAGLVSISYSISAAERIDDSSASKISKKLMKSQIKVSLVSYTDKEIYRFIELIQGAFPSGIQITSLELEPNEEVTPQNLKIIGSGKPVGFVKGELVFDWLTLLDDESAAGNQQQGMDPNLMMPEGMEM